MIAAALVAAAVTLIGAGHGWRVARARSAHARAGRPRTPPGRHRRSPSVQQTIDALDALAGEVRSGRSLQSALSGASAATRAAILPAVPDPVQPHVAMAMQATQAAIVLGGAQAVALDTAAALLRERQQLDLERRSQGAQARLSAKVMTIVPVAFTAWVLATNDAARAAAITPIGIGSLAGGALLNVSGWLWMRRIVSAVW